MQPLSVFVSFITKHCFSSATSIEGLSLRIRSWKPRGAWSSRDRCRARDSLLYLYPRYTEVRFWSSLLTDSVGEKNREKWNVKSKAHCFGSFGQKKNERVGGFMSIGWGRCHVLLYRVGWKSLAVQTIKNMFTLKASSVIIQDTRVMTYEPRRITHRFIWVTHPCESVYQEKIKLFCSHLEQETCDETNVQGLMLKYNNLF